MLFEILKVRRTGIADDLFTRLAVRAMGEHERTGAVPLRFLQEDCAHET